MYLKSADAPPLSLRSAPVVIHGAAQLRLSSLSVAVPQGCHRRGSTASRQAAHVRPIADTPFKGYRWCSGAVPVIELFNRSLGVALLQERLKQRTLPWLKKSDLDPQSYRPISSLSVLSKLLQRLVAWQPIDYLTAFKLLRKLRSAYRAHHSTETAVLNGVRCCPPRCRLRWSGCAYAAGSIGCVRHRWSRSASPSSWWCTYIRFMPSWSWHERAAKTFIWLRQRTWSNCGCDPTDCSWT